MASAPQYFERRSWMWMSIQGRRLELGLTVATFIILSVSRDIFGALAPTLVGIVFLAIFVVYRDLRNGLSRRLISNRREARLNYLFWYCNVVGRGGQLPSLQSVRDFPAGKIYLLELPVGLYLESLEKRLPELTVAFGARVLRLHPSRENAQFVELTVTYGDTFQSEYSSPLLRTDICSLWEPVVLGVGEDGAPVSISLFEHNLLIGGEPGSGKSVAMSSIVAAGALDPKVHLVLLDGKEVEFSLWLDVAGQFAGHSQQEAVRVLEDVRTEMDERYRDLAVSRKRKIEKLGHHGLILVVIDEMALYLRGGDKLHRDKFADVLRDLISRGRAAGVVVVAATQKPSGNVKSIWPHRAHYIWPHPGQSGNF